MALLGGMLSPVARGAEATAPAVQVSRDQDALWAWIERLDGDIGALDVQHAALEQADVDLIERAFAERGVGLDVPYDLYDDPLAALTVDPLRLDKIDPSQFGIPFVAHPAVVRWMEVLLGPGRGYFRKWLARKGRYEAMILAKLDAAELPRELIYLAMIESGFSPYAYSHAHASGVWQFIPSTGRAYGLAVDFWLDERRDPELATDAALKMLGELHRQFGDWHLAFAAYNAGPSRVRRALDRVVGVTPDYWALLDQDLLADETKGYVPKILAAMVLATYAERYGLDDVEPEAPIAYDAVVVDEAIDVAALARCAGIDEEAFRELNPALRRFTLPEGGARLRVPVGTAEAFSAKVAALPPSEKRTVVMHRVASGESLSTIAVRYGVSTDAIVQANRISDPDRLYIGQKLVVPAPGGEVVASREPERATPRPASTAPSALRATTASPSSRTAGGDRYVVRSGDSLWSIANAHGVTVDDLVRINGISERAVLSVGQELRVRGASASSSSSSSSSGTWTVHVVRSGDSLSEIAERYGVSVAELQRWNGISGTLIRAGDRLKVRRK